MVFPRVAVESQPLRRASVRKREPLSHFKRGYQRKVVRGKQRGAGAVDAKAGEMKVAIVVKMIKMQDRKNSRVGATIREASSQLSYLECFSHEA